MVLARNGVPVARLVPSSCRRPRSRFLAAYGTLAGRIAIGGQFRPGGAGLPTLTDKGCSTSSDQPGEKTSLFRDRNWQWDPYVPRHFPSAVPLVRSS